MVGVFEAIEVDVVEVLVFGKRILANVGVGRTLDFFARNAEMVSEVFGKSSFAATECALKKD